MDRVNYLQCHRALAALPTAHPLLGVEATLSPYEGCFSACVYCPHAAAPRVGVKTDFMHLLARELKALPRALHLGLGTSCEPYGEQEKEFRLTRNTIETVMEAGMPLQIFTRSWRILKDADLLRRYSKEGALTVSVSVFTTDVVLASLFEPGEPGPDEAFALLKELRKHSIMAGAVYAPIIPCVSDSEEDISSVVSRVREAGGEYLLPLVLSLESDTVRRRIEKVVAQAFPQSAAGFASLYEGGRLPSREYCGRLDSLVSDVCRKRAVPAYLSTEKDIPLFAGVGHEFPR